MTWSVWYVRYMSGRGVRVRTKSANAVYGGAGSTSQMVSGVPKRDYQLGKEGSTSIIRFSSQYLKNHPTIETNGVTLEEWKEYKHRQKIGEDQTSLEDSW